MKCGRTECRNRAESVRHMSLDEMSAVLDRCNECYFDTVFSGEGDDMKTVFKTRVRIADEYVKRYRETIGAGPVR